MPRPMFNINVPNRFPLIPLLTGAAFILTACAPQPTGSGPAGGSDRETTGTAAAAGQTVQLMRPLEGATYVPPQPPVTAPETSGVLELRAKPAPQGVNLPFPDAFVVEDIEPGKRGGNFTFCTFSDPKTFDPITANESSSTNIIGRMYEGLIGFDIATQSYYPSMLKELVTENGNAAVWLARLRDGLKWSDGQPVTADDIMFSFQVTMDPKVVNPAKDMLQVAGQPLKMEKVDNLTVRITCAAPTGLLHVILGSLSLVPKHSLEAAYQAGTYDTALNINVDPAKVVVSGPFKLRQFVSGERTILERNPHYFRYDKTGQQLPYLDTFTFSVVPDTSAMLLRFLGGGADAISFPRPQDLFQLRDQQKEKNYTLYDCGPRDTVSFLWFNQKSGTSSSGNPFVDPAKLELFKNVDFRRACYHALNKDAIINSVLRGQAVSVWSEVSPALTFWSNPDVRKYPFDLAKSKEILDSLDMKDRDGDGVRETTSGVKLSFTFITNKGNKSREEIATLLAADLKAAGIQAIPQYIDFPALVTKLNDTYEYEACYLGFGGAIHPISSMNVLRSSGRTHFWNPLQETPATAWEAEIDKLCDQFVLALAPKEQQNIYYRIQMIISENVPHMPLFTDKAFHVVRNTFGNVKPAGIADIFWNADELYVKQ